MSTSTDAILFYGYYLPDEDEIPDEAADTYLNTAAPVQIGYHCSDSSSVPFVCWGSSRTVAARGYPESITPTNLTVPAGVDEQIRAFATRHGLPLPGAPADPDWPEDKASDLGWWLVSWWG